MWAELGISAVKALAVLALVLSLSALLLWVERKGSALIQDRIGANRATIFGVLPFNLGLIQTLFADTIKALTKEDVRPGGADRFLYVLAPWMAVFPALVSYAVIPFGDTLRIGGRTVELRAATLDVGVLYVLAMLSLGVYGVVLAGWSSNNRLSLLGAVRGSAQMISYEIGMGLALVVMVMTYGTLDLQEMVRAQGAMIWGWLPAWGVLYQPLALLILLTAGIAESKRVPFDLPEAESELVAGYFTEYSGSRHICFMLTDFVEIVIVAGLVTTLFFGGWQVPYLGSGGLALPGGVHLPLPHLAVVLLQVAAFAAKVFFFAALQILIRWSLPRLRYDQLMRFGWLVLLPLGLVNVLVSGAVIVLTS